VHGPDQRVPPGELFQPALQIGPDDSGIGLQPLLLDHVQHGQPGHAGSGAAAGRGEEVPGVPVPPGDLPGGDDGAERVAVAHRLGHRDHVRHHALLLEPPEPVAQAAVADLDLVRDGHPAVPPDLRVHRGQVTVGQRQAAGVAVERLGQERRGRPSPGRQRTDKRDRVGRVPRRRRTPVPPAVGVRRVHRVHPAGPGGQRVRVVGGGRGDGVGGVRPAVIGLAHRHHVLASGCDQRQPQGQVHRLRPRVDQEHRIQRRRQ
jgi:hypothetical protein